MDYLYELRFYRYDGTNIFYHSKMEHNGGYGINTWRIENGIAYLNTADGELGSLCGWHSERLMRTKYYLFHKENEQSLILKAYRGYISKAKKQEIEMCRGIAHLYNMQLEQIEPEDYSMTILVDGLNGVINKIKKQFDSLNNLLPKRH